MQHKKQTLSAIFLLVVGLTGVKAQESTTATGGNARGDGGSVSYTVGQVFYTSNSGEGGTCAQGVQQPYEITIVSGIEHEGIKLECTAYPNPATSHLVLYIEASTMGTQKNATLEYKLFDTNGKLLANQPISSSETTIPMENYPAETYILNIISGKSEIKSFKIVKQ